MPATMSSDSCEVILSSDEEPPKKNTHCEEEKTKKSKKMKSAVRSSSSSEASDEDRKDDSKARICRRSDSLYLEITPSETKYRSKQFSRDKVMEMKINCTCCNKNLKSFVAEGRDVFSHPVLRVLLCKECCNFYGDGNFSLDDDGSDKYCRWCGQGGNLYCCSTCSCAFCRPCLKRNLNRAVLDEVKSEDWQCFICQPKPLWNLRAICSAAQELANKTKKKQKLKQKSKLEALCNQKTSIKDSPRSVRLKQQKHSARSSSEDHSKQRGKSKRSLAGKESSDSDESSDNRVPPKKSVKNNRKVASSSDSEKEPAKKKKTAQKNDGSSSESGTVSSKMKSMKSRPASDGVVKVVKVDRKSAKKACLWLQEACDDISNVADLTSSRSSSLYTKGVNVINMTSVKNVTKTVNRIRYLVDLSVKNLTLASDNVKLAYDRWLSKQQAKQTAEICEVKEEQSEPVASSGKKGRDRTVEPVASSQKEEDDLAKTRIKIKSVDAINEAWGNGKDDVSSSSKLAPKERDSSDCEIMEVEVVPATLSDSARRKRGSRSRDKVEEQMDDGVVCEKVSQVQNKVEDKMEVEVVCEKDTNVKDNAEDKMEVEVVCEKISQTQDKVEDMVNDEVVCEKDIKVKDKIDGENDEDKLDDVCEKDNRVQDKYKNKVLSKRNHDRNQVEGKKGSVESEVVSEEDEVNDKLDDYDVCKNGEVVLEKDEVGVSLKNSRKRTELSDEEDVRDNSEVGDKEKGSIGSEVRNYEKEGEMQEGLGHSSDSGEDRTAKSDQDEELESAVKGKDIKKEGKKGRRAVLKVVAHDEGKVDKGKLLPKDKGELETGVMNGLSSDMTASEARSSCDVAEALSDAETVKLCAVSDNEHSDCDMFAEDINDMEETGDDPVKDDEKTGDDDVQEPEKTGDDQLKRKKKKKTGDDQLQDEVKTDDEVKKVENSGDDQVKEKVKKKNKKKKTVDDQLQEEVKSPDDKVKEMEEAGDDLLKEEVKKNSKKKKKAGDDQLQEQVMSPDGKVKEVEKTGDDQLKEEVKKKKKKTDFQLEEVKTPGDEGKEEKTGDDQLKEEVETQDGNLKEVEKTGDDQIKEGEEEVQTGDDQLEEKLKTRDDMVKEVEKTEDDKIKEGEEMKTEDDLVKEGEDIAGSLVKEEIVGHPIRMETEDDQEKVETEDEILTSGVPLNTCDGLKEGDKSDELLDEQIRAKKDNTPSKYTEDALKAKAALLEDGSEESSYDSDNDPAIRVKRKRRRAKRKTLPTKKSVQKGKTKGTKKKADESSLDSSITDLEDSDSTVENMKPKLKKICSKSVEDKTKEQMDESEVLKENGDLAKAAKNAETTGGEEEEKKETAKKKKKSEIDEIKSLTNLKTLKSGGIAKKGDDSSDESGPKKVKKSTSSKKGKKEVKTTLKDFENTSDSDDDLDDVQQLPSGADDRLHDLEASFKELHDRLERKRNEMAKSILQQSSSSESESESNAEDGKKKASKKKNIKTAECNGKVKQEVTSDLDEKPAKKKPEDDDDEEAEDDSDEEMESLFLSLQKKKKNWRTNKLLRGKFFDTSSSEEDRRWKVKKEREMKNELARKKGRRRLFSGSDSDDKSVASPSSSGSSSEVVFKTSKRKATSTSVSEKDFESSSSDKKKKRRKPAAKRRRIKTLSDSDSDNKNDSAKGDTPGKGRKNIRAVMKDDSVAEATRQAAKEEEERRKRIAEKQELYNRLYNELQEGVAKVDKLILDFNPETKEELVKVDEKLVQKLKPHQAKGVKFMWDACFESLKDCETSKGSGCILAHCMGLGKSLQVVTLVHTLMRYEGTKVKTVLIVCPLSTVLNWVNEFNMWLKETDNEDNIEVFELTRYKKNFERAHQLKDWHKCGGVMVLGYEMYRNLTTITSKRARKNAIAAFTTTLVDPGPDLVVCDEGHLLKNEDTALSKAMRMIKTLRRIVLTGTPLQNNLKEYHCMVQFVKPNLLGTRKEFLNRFVNPITNGQFEDSTSHDVKIMKRRAHVLHKMLEGCVQRFDYSVLMPFLPPKHEYVISVRLTELQSKLYQYYLTHLARGGSAGGAGTGKGAKLFSDFQFLQRIWTHPRVLQMDADKKADKSLEQETDSEGSLKDFIDDDETTEPSSKSSSSSSDSSDDNSGSGGKPKKEVVKKWQSSTRGAKKKGEEGSAEEEEKKVEEDPVAQEWWQTYLKGDELESIKESGKLMLLFSILRDSEKIGDKVLVFSQSLYSLDLIEYFLSRIDAATQNNKPEENLCNHTGSWSPGLDYFRLDGAVPCETRNAWCKSFNREDNYRARLFLISTRAGGLGINLFAANRVIIFDVSWNPSHDVQSIFRVYRFGQKKPCYIYRFLALGTMEEKIYDRQVAKLSISCRVIDEQQIERHFNFADLNELYSFDPEQKTKRPTPILPKDRLLAELLKDHESVIETYHEHDSLLENKQEEELNEEERKAAWEDYENEKKGLVVQQNPVQGGGIDMNLMLQYNQMSQLNPQVIRAILKKQYPTMTEEQLQLQYRLVIQQIYDYSKGFNAQNLASGPSPQQQQSMNLAQQQQNLLLLQQQQQQQLLMQKQVQQQGLSSSMNYQYQQLLRHNQLQQQQQQQQQYQPMKMSTVSKHVKVTDFGPLVQANYRQNPYASSVPPAAHASSNVSSQWATSVIPANSKLLNPLSTTKQTQPTAKPVVLDTIDVED